ncbi:hypothetical protein BJF93_04955 [Xaviernesmea oryzae]|uniref:DUF2442 domain-containing protein n=1 Tax=Xaviernesmea oryzae TaxID=464029 RepID=A0A1Q9AUW2_9HYPH|nr:DUF2442 domain-containing protein [Xaviernesmea oryzae]OLP59242.1 hypothetical protein BJF93_04955 [Xaviernesmea oryzae]SEK80025.1 Protein of unknown function [Xaviernesmea oryzae]
MANVSDIELDAAKSRWLRERAERPIPVSVRFDPISERILVDFSNGAAFLFPARAVEFLQDATPEQLAEVELLGETGLHWESLDVDYSIEGLMNGIFGSRAFMQQRNKTEPNTNEPAQSRTRAR